MSVITRYAPSPTGNPHVGNIRTAIFAYLHARSQGGKFLLRIEDTDRARFVPEAVKYIEDSLHWLGIEYDDEKKFQSGRLPLYKEHADRLLKEGRAYKCFCSSERLDALRSKQQEKGVPTGYDKKCRYLSREEVAELEASGEGFVIRFAMPEEGTAVWKDLVRGDVKIEFALSDDPVIIKSDGWPTYHLANVVDDHEMAVTDVIRGEEWIPSTPKHIALYDAFGWNSPKFGHLPLIIGPDRAKLSKRHGDTAILDYKDKGYLPEAMLNFLATLGWNDGTEQELFTREELILKFNVTRIAKSPAVFDIDKLNWLNGQYVRKYENEQLTDLIAETIPNLRLLKQPNFDKILTVEKSRLIILTDIAEDTDFYLKISDYDPNIIIFKKSTPESTKKGLMSFYEALDKTKSDLNMDEYHNLLETVVKENSLNNGDVFWPVRVALSGKEKSPSPVELLWVFGKDESIKRLKKAIELITK